jgi:hypothetical protein
MDLALKVSSIICLMINNCFESQGNSFLCILNSATKYIFDRNMRIKKKSRRPVISVLMEESQ